MSSKLCDKNSKNANLDIEKKSMYLTFMGQYFTPGSETKYLPNEIPSST